VNAECRESDDRRPDSRSNVFESRLEATA
jgi:hypothetical protein